MLEINFNTKKLDSLIAALKESGDSHVKVGVLGNDTWREEGMTTNAEIARIHEFGIGQHQRSFLRVPLMNHLNDELKEAGAFSKKSIDAILKAGTFKPFFGKVAIIAERIVMDAFESGGDGKWPESNMDNKVTQKTLIETRQLMRSITSSVEDD